MEKNLIKNQLENRKNELFALFPESLVAENDKAYLAPYRSAFMRDRDRILYSRPFLRLGGKTQV